MPRAVFTVELPEDVWIGRLSRANPTLQFRVLAAFPGETSGYGLLEIETEDPMAIVEAMRNEETVQRVEVVQSAEDRIVLQFETTDLPLLVTVQRAQVPLELPIEITNGQVQLELTAPRDRLSEFDEQLTKLNITHRLEGVYQTVEAETPLTDTQRRAITTAIDEGYYDTPRQTTLTDLAEEMDIAPSTLSETLHRAEETIVKRFAADRLGFETETPD